MLDSMPRPRTEWKETDYGVWQLVYHADLMRNTYRGHDAHFFMPAGFMRIEHREHEIKYQSWYVPIDDTHTIRFQAGFAAAGENGARYEWPPEEPFIQPGPENDYFRDYDGVDTLSGIPGRSAPGTAVKGFLCQDSMVNESQGPIVDRRWEHLGAQDQPLVAIRYILLRAIDDVQAGREPKHILHDHAANDLVRVDVA
jgi:hypothetical protein